MLYFYVLRAKVRMLIFFEIFEFIFLNFLGQKHPNPNY